MEPAVFGLMETELPADWSLGDKARDRSNGAQRMWGAMERAAKSKPVGGEVHRGVPVSPGRSELPNHELVTLVVYLLGGASKRVDTEDVAVKANELAPGRFAWKRHPDQINLEIIRVYLSDAKKQTKGGYLLGSGLEGWCLTPKGLEFARQNIRKLSKDHHPRPSISQQEKRWRSRERERLMSTEAFAHFKAGQNAAVSRQEAEAFFRVDDYVTGPAREAKVSRILEAFGDDPKLGTMVRALASRIRKEGANE